ncbi:prepilin-type N-terminal cleavage/methylation domain-containing protein [Undibacterium arcticum]|uniref:Prepilin-type N-terminal cleavage/methylation domain-containing protein n=1 Tax=Undibacterium arcticum TaxID=1762892 RepID=A0ABV7F7F0_9BURK
MTHRYEIKKNRSQSGYTLVELIAVAAIVATVASAGYAIKYATSNYKSLDAAAVAIGQYGNAVDNFETKFATELLDGTAIAGVTDPYHPTVKELVSLGMLPPGFNQSRLPGGDMLTTIQKVPAGCAPGSCDLYWMTVASKPFMQATSNNVDEAGAGRVVKAIGAQAGYSPRENPGVFKGYNDSWGAGIANPVGQAGVVAMRGGYGASVLAKFLRTDGGNQMSADFKGGGHNLTGVSNMTATGTVTTQNLAATNGYINTLQGNTATLTGNIKAADATLGNVTASGIVHTAAGLVSDGYAQVASWISGASLATSGDIAAGNNVSGQTVSGVNVVAANNVQATGTVLGSQVQSSGDVTAQGNVFAAKTVSAMQLTSNSYIGVGGVINPGGFCNPDGTLARDGTGQSYACVSGIWKATQADTGSAYVTYVPVADSQIFGRANQVNGKFLATDVTDSIGNHSIVPTQMGYTGRTGGTCTLVNWTTPCTVGDQTSGCDANYAGLRPASIRFNRYMYPDAAQSATFDVIYAADRRFDDGSGTCQASNDGGAYYITTYHKQ